MHAAIDNVTQQHLLVLGANGDEIGTRSGIIEVPQSDRFTLQYGRIIFRPNGLCIMGRMMIRPYG